MSLYRTIRAAKAEWIPRDATILSDTTELFTNGGVVVCLIRDELWVLRVFSVGDSYGVSVDFSKHIARLQEVAA